MNILDMKHIKKSFDGLEVLKDISLDVEEGEVLSIIGPSGSGKPTLLRCINFWRHRPPGMWYFMETAWWIKRSMRQHTVQK